MDTPTEAAPWQWTPDLAPWFHSLAQHVDSWRPAVEITADRSPAEMIVSAAEHGAPWLYHPCIGAVTHRRRTGQTERDVALLGWVAGHAGADAEFTLPAPTWCWSPE